MKILRPETGLEQGPFKTVEETETGYLADGSFYPAVVIGPCEVVDVAEDYVPQWQQDAAAAAAREAFNAEQKKKRAAAYRDESDPLFFQAQRGEATMQEWQDKVAEIGARFPYQA